jgi:hypothetical protein
MNFANTIPFDWLLWFVPCFLMIHNLEEAPLMENWARQLPVKIRLIESRRQFITAVTFLTLIGFLLTYLGLNIMTAHAGRMLIFSMQMTVALNVFFPHLMLALRFRRYNPGLVSALFLNLPFSIHLFQRALNENLLAPHEFWFLLAISPLIMIASIFISLKLGKLFG